MIKLEVGKKYRDREGREYECVYRNIKRAGTDLEMVLVCNGGRPTTRHITGEYYSDKRHDVIDLIAEVVPPVEVWVNFYPTLHSSVLYKTRKEADKCANNDRISCQKITIVPGDGL